MSAAAVSPYAGARAHRAASARRPWWRGAAEEDDAAHLKRAVQPWDLAGDRRLEVSGPGAGALMRELTPRDLAWVPDGRRAYAPVRGPGGTMLGDPMAMRLAPDRWLLTGAADLASGIAALAGAMHHPVHLPEPDLHPLAAQGPLAEDLVARAMGEGVRALGPMEWRRIPFGDGAPIVARSDLSRQGGFAVLVEGRHRARPLSEAPMEAGQGLGVRATTPSPVARIEGGLLAWGVDMGPDLTPFEAGLGRLCDGDHDHVGRAALRARREPARAPRPLEIDGPPLPPPEAPWPLLAGEEGRTGCRAPLGRTSTASTWPSVSSRAPTGRPTRGSRRRRPPAHAARGCAKRSGPEGDTACSRRSSSRRRRTAAPAPPCRSCRTTGCPGPRSRWASSGPR